MSQKINPISNKIGILQLWSTNCVLYGNNFKFYKNIIKFENYIKYYIKTFYKNNFFLISNLKIIYTYNQVFIIIIFFKLFENQNKLWSKTKLTKGLLNWLNCFVSIQCYEIFSLNFSSFLLSNYIEHILFNTQQLSRNVLSQIYSILLQQKNKIKLVKTKNGVKNVKFSGFKIQFKGCFEISKSQMSKTLKHSFGNNSLTTIKGYIEYSEKTIFTRYGVCGLKIWFFFEFI